MLAFATKAKPLLRLAISASCVPDKRKATTQFPNGEDAYFLVQGKALGLADGVGSWSLKGIDSGLFSRHLMSKAAQYLNDNPSCVDPKQAMAHAEQQSIRANLLGTCTYCTLTLNGNELKSAVLGDSGFVVLRRKEKQSCVLSPSSCCFVSEKNDEWKVVYKSQEQQHAFNTPFQIGLNCRTTTMKDAVTATIPLHLGDVVIVGSDGIFDNLFLRDVCSLVKEFMDKNEPKDNFASFITQAAEKASMNSKRRSPFSTQSAKSGFEPHGGKQDDITALVALVCCLECAKM